MSVEKKPTGYLVYTSHRPENAKKATYLNPDQMERAFSQALTRSSANPNRLPDPTTARRVVPLYGRGI